MASTSNAGGTIRVDRRYAHPLAKVWRALTESELLAGWLMENDFEPVVGHRFTFRTDPGPGFDGIIHCEVLVLDEPHRMEWAWRGGPLDTVVVFELEALGDHGTRLHVTHSGFRGAKSRMVQWILAIGNRTLYGKRLPRLLDSLEGKSGAGPDSPISMDPPKACMSPWQRFLIAATRWIPGRSGGEQTPESVQPTKQDRDRNP